MTKQKEADQLIHRKFHSKASKEGLAILTQEIELALQWERPSILLVVHNSITGRMDAQEALRRELFKKEKHVVQINIESANPDVIRVMNETPNSGDTVFFVSGIENADRTSDGKVYRALNIRRELLVESRICAVFWLNESEAANLPRLAPDFWAFRHRVVEFAPKHGTKKQTIPAGLFLWEEQFPWMESAALKRKLVLHEKSLQQFRIQDSAVTFHLETLLKLAHYCWLLNDLQQFSSYLNDGIHLLEKYPLPQYRAWILNAQGIGLYEEGNKKDANLRFSQALSYQASNSVLMMNTSIAAHGLGRNRDAIITGRQAIKKDSGNSQLWYRLGYLFLSMGKIEAAVEALKKSQDLDPLNMGAHYGLATCYHKNEQFHERDKELSRAASISAPQNALQRAYIGILHGKTDEVLKQLKGSLAMGEVHSHEILRDPNLHILINPKEFMEPD